MWGPRQPFFFSVDTPGMETPACDERPQTHVRAQGWVLAVEHLCAASTRGADGTASTALCSLHSGQANVRTTRPAHLGAGTWGGNICGWEICLVGSRRSKRNSRARGTQGYALLPSASSPTDFTYRFSWSEQWPLLGWALDVWRGVILFRSSKPTTQTDTWCSHCCFPLCMYISLSQS